MVFRRVIWERLRKIRVHTAYLPRAKSKEKFVDAVPTKKKKIWGRARAREGERRRKTRDRVESDRVPLVEIPGLSGFLPIRKVGESILPPGGGALIQKYHGASQRVQRNRLLTTSFSLSLSHSPLCEKATDTLGDHRGTATHGFQTANEQIGVLSLCLSLGRFSKTFSRPKFGIHSPGFFFILRLDPHSPALPFPSLLSLSLSMIPDVKEERAMKQEFETAEVTPNRQEGGGGGSGVAVKFASHDAEDPFNWSFGKKMRMFMCALAITYVSAFNASANGTASGGFRKSHQGVTSNEFQGEALFFVRGGRGLELTSKPSCSL